MKKINRLYILLLVLSMHTSINANSDHENNLETILSFEDFISRVGSNNASLLAEKLNIDIAEAELLAQKVFPDPNVSFFADGLKYNVGISYLLELGGKRNSRIRLAKSLSEYENLSLIIYFQQLRLQAAEVYMDAILQQKLLNVKIESYEYMNKLSVSDSLRYVAGDISVNDARQSKLEAITLLNDVYDQEAICKTAQAVLNQYMGVTIDAISTLNFDWELLKKEISIVELLEIGIERRVELIAADKNIEINNLEYTFTKAMRFPDIELSIGYERDWHIFNRPIHSLGAGISLPLKFSNTNKGMINANKLRIEQSNLRKQELKLQIESEIKQAWYLYEAEKRKEDQFRQGILEESQKILDGILYKYERGEANILDVLLAQRNHNEINEQYLKTQKELASALINLENKCGIWTLDF